MNARERIPEETRDPGLGEKWYHTGKGASLERKVMLVLGSSFRCLKSFKWSSPHTGHLGKVLKGWRHSIKGVLGRTARAMSGSIWVGLCACLFAVEKFSKFSSSLLDLYKGQDLYQSYIIWLYVSHCLMLKELKKKTVVLSLLSRSSPPH